MRKNCVMVSTTIVQTPLWSPQKLLVLGIAPPQRQVMNWTMIQMHMLNVHRFTLTGWAVSVLIQHRLDVPIDLVPPVLLH